MQLLTEKAAAEMLGLPASTFRKVWKRFGLKRYNLNEGLRDLSGKPLKNCWRFLKSDIEALIRYVVNKTDKKALSIDELYESAKAKSKAA